MEGLSDPCNDREIKSVPLPPAKPLKTELFWHTVGEEQVPNWKLIKDHFSLEGRVTKNDIRTLINQTKKIMRNEPNLIEVAEPTVIVGDIHGQYFDLVHMLEKAGSPEKLNYVFLGDYVDRGIYSVECVVLLMCMKCNFPKTLYLMRGNHECRNLTEHFTFREEVLEKFDLELYDLIMETFDHMPLACLANQ